jgi:large conductance mechanosensitive channel
VEVLGRRPSRTDRGPLQFLKANLAEFWEFAFKGNLISLAIGVVLGGAFGALIKSFVDNIFMPFISLPGKYMGDSGKGYLGWEWQGVKYGLFIGDLISFLIIAAAIFVLMVKVVGWVVKLTRKPAAPSDPTEKECPLCLMKIPAKAVRCGHCTADLGGPTSTTAPVVPA